METRARVKLSSNDVEKLNEVCEQIQEIADSGNVDLAGPIPLPTKVLKIPTRKAVSGDGTATWERWEMRIHKRLLDMDPNERVMRQIMRIKVPEEVNIEIEVTS
ncbi:MAG: 30S ribosomal protein S10 [Candidatus Undinarchaeales archaeon]